MVESVRHIDPSKIIPNEENPRLIFREEELLALEKSIAAQGILVPLTVFTDGDSYVILDGERRWRCARKLGLTTVPANVQSKPDRIQNIMMMFAIHQARTEWDPLPTALKLDELKYILAKRYGRVPTDGQLAASASMSVGEVRRYRRILGLPEKYKTELLNELKKPRVEQILTVDHVMETVKGSEALKKREIIDSSKESILTEAIIDKFRRKVLTSTVEPRLMPNMARAVERGDLSAGRVRLAVQRLIDEPNYTVNQAYADTIALIDFEHGSEQLADRLVGRLQEQIGKTRDVGEGLVEALLRLRALIDAVIKDGRT